MTDAPRQPDPLRARVGQLLEAALNRVLALDPALDLNALEGRRIGIEMRGLGIALAIGVQDGKLRVGPHWQARPDLNVRAAPASLLAFALRRGDDAPMPPGKVEISGDAHLARTLEKIARGFEPDFEEAFAASFGDVLGVPLARALRGAFGWARESVQALTLDTAEFLREESRDVVARGELEGFLDEVDALRERTERLAARITRVVKHA